MQLKRVNRGSPLAIPAEAYNAFIDMARRDRRGLHVRQAVVQQPTSRPSASSVLVRNDSGADLARFAVAGISGIVIAPGYGGNTDEFQEQPCFSVVTPAESTSSGDSHLGKFVVLCEPLPANGVGWALVDGIAVVQVNIADNAHEWADIKDADNTQLESTDMGTARIIYKAGTSGTQWCIVRLCDPAAILGLRWNSTTFEIEATRDGVNWEAVISADPACDSVVS